MTDNEPLLEPGDGKAPNYNEAIEMTINLDPKSPPLSPTRRWLTSIGGSCGLF